MKRFSLIALSLMAVFSLMACGGDNNEESENDNNNGEEASQIKEQLEQRLKQQKEQEAIKELADDAEENYDIEKDLEASEDGEDAVVATVDDKDIVNSELQQIVEQQKMQLEQMPQEDGEKIDFESEEGKEMLARIEEGALDSLIQNEVLYQEAKDEGIEASQDEVDEQIKALEEQYGSEEEVDKALEESGLTMESYEGLLKEQLIVQEYVDEEVSVEVSDEEIDEAYEDYKERAEQQEEQQEDGSE